MSLSGTIPIHVDTGREPSSVRLRLLEGGDASIVFNFAGTPLPSGANCSFSYGPEDDAWKMTHSQMLSEATETVTMLVPAASLATSGSFRWDFRVVKDSEKLAWAYGPLELIHQAGGAGGVLDTTPVMTQDVDGGGHQIANIRIQLPDGTTIDSADDLYSAHSHETSEVNGLDAALGAKADSSALAAHSSDSSNPHGVTKAQVGLGNVDNTADADKPVSTPQQTALDEIKNPEQTETAISSAANFVYLDPTNGPLQKWTVTENATVSWDNWLSAKLGQITVRMVGGDAYTLSFPLGFWIGDEPTITSDMLIEVVSKSGSSSIRGVAIDLS